MYGYDGSRIFRIVNRGLIRLVLDTPIHVAGLEPAVSTPKVLTSVNVNSDMWKQWLVNVQV